MINEVKFPWNIRQGMNQIVLGNEGIIGGVEGEEPVPVGVEAEQDSSKVPALVVGGVGREVEDVAVPWVVDCEEEP